jgi:hypothetical protein
MALTATEGKLPLVNSVCQLNAGERDSGGPAR